MSSGKTKRKVKLTGKAKKLAYLQRLLALMEQYPRIILVTCDNIGSKHMQDIRKSLRGKAILLMGKNTLIRRAIKTKADEHPEWQSILPHIKMNVGMVFTKESLRDLKTILVASKVPAIAKTGALAPQDVVVPKGITPLEPTKTSFFAALDIATKITRGNVEIISDVPLIKAGEKVGNSQATLLQMLDIKPFEYGLKLTNVYDNGSCYKASMLSITEDDLYKAFAAGVSNVTCLALGLDYPALPALPHVVARAYKNLLAIVMETDYVFDQAKDLKELITNPDALAAAQAKAAAATTTTITTVVTPTTPAIGTKVEAEKPEEQEESGDMMGGFFDM